MSEIRKNIIYRLLKEKKKTKRELAEFLGINENSISRMLSSPNISYVKLEKIANFLEVKVSDITEQAFIALEEKEKYKPHENKVDENIFNTLTEAIEIQRKMIDIIMRILSSKNQTNENCGNSSTDKSQ
jgi:DNA-binding Xre family transcriptional regulator